MSWRVVVSLSQNSAETVNDLTIWTVTGQCSGPCPVWFASVDESTVSEQPFQHVTFCSGEVVSWICINAHFTPARRACLCSPYMEKHKANFCSTSIRIASWGLNTVLALLQARLIWKDSALSTREIQFMKTRSCNSPLMLF